MESVIVMNVMVEIINCIEFYGGNLIKSIIVFGAMKGTLNHFKPHQTISNPIHLLFPKDILIFVAKNCNGYCSEARNQIYIGRVRGLCVGSAFYLFFVSA